MNPTRTMLCGRCHALRWVEDWREDRDETMSVTLGPCGHMIERSARLEWSIHSGRGRPLRPARAGLTSVGVSTSS
jgi:hypothetical protein